MGGMAWQRDPVSVWFDAPARRLVERAYAVKGQWAGVYLGPPGPAQLAELAALGISPWGRDRWGEVRWVRGFKRAVFWQLNHYGTVRELAAEPNLAANAAGAGWVAPVRGQWETGALVRKAGWPTRRRAVRFRIHAGGAATSRIGKEETPARERWIDDRGHATDRVSFAPDPHAWVER